MERARLEPEGSTAAEPGLTGARNAVKTLLRYTLFQIPGVVLVGGLLVFAVEREWLGGQFALLSLAIWLLKDVALYPLLRGSYEPGGIAGDAMRWRGRRGEAREELNPVGYVIVSGELWRAEAIESDVPIRAGEWISVEEVAGPMLKVRRVQGEDTLRST
jgi:membrane protein implicated in regulation of membrane protease activity